jgi:hypothetical protein
MEGACCAPCGRRNGHPVRTGIMKAKASKSETASVAASVAPEDLKRGDFVGALSELIELPSFLWCDSLPGERDEVVRVRYLPAHGGVPRKVKAICLPFVYTQSPGGQRQVIDIRKVQLVRLQTGYAKAVWKDLRRMDRRPPRKKHRR